MRHCRRTSAPSPFRTRFSRSRKAAADALLVNRGHGNDMSAAQPGTKPYYYIPQPSHWAITGSCALLLMALGAAFWMNHLAAGPYILFTGIAVLIFMMFGWFGTVIGESEHRLYNKRVDTSFRWSMSWFIFSEVMFFAAFFGALFYVRNISVPDLGSELTGRLLWPNYAPQWPTVGPYLKQ